MDSGHRIGYLVCMVKRVTVMVYEDFGFLDVVGPADVFTIANQRAGKTLYAVEVACAGRARLLRAESGLRLGIDVDSRELEQTHTLIVTGGNGFRKALSNRLLMSEVVRLSKASRRVVSICTGAFVLAHAGLLDGRQATTHWAHARDFAAAYPAVDLVPDELFVSSGRFVTAAGIAAGMDLALALVARDHGDELARQTSQRMVLYLNRSGGQSQFSERFKAVAERVDPLDELLVAISADPVGNLTNAALAEQLGISERHFVRVFRDRTGTTPARWIERVRVDRARESLESSDYSVESVSRSSGFASVETMRQAFQRAMGMAPSEYRTRHATLAS